MKKLLLWCTVFTLLVTINIPSFADGDEPSGWAKELVNEAISKGYVPERLQGDYGKSITREEFAELFVTAVFSEVNRNEVDRTDEGTKYRWHFQELTVDNFLSKVSTTKKFTDTDSKYIKVANVLGMVNGVGNNTFNPDGLITREQACIMFVNYFQTIVHSEAGFALTHVDDIDQVSSWAKKAVIWIYDSRILEGTRKYITELKEGAIKPDVKQLAHFDPKGNLTREQAIVVIARLGNPAKNSLANLVLRGYLRINMDVLMIGFDIDGNTLKMKSSGYDAKYSHIKQFFRTQTRFKDYVDKYRTDQLIGAIWAPNGTPAETYNNIHIDNVLSGKQMLYDYTQFTIEYNKDGYLSIITINDFNGYFEFIGGALFHRPDDWNGPPVLVKRKEIK